MNYQFRRDAAGWAGLALVAYSAILYPLIGWLAGDSWRQMPAFGTAPCPVTIFTFGMLLMARPLFSRWIMAIPFAWSLIGGSAAFFLNVQQDWLLLFTGFIAFAMSFLGQGSQVRQA
jgi:hypothetical protein